MCKLSETRFDQLVDSLQELMEENPELKKEEIKNLFLKRRRHAKNFLVIESSWTDLWREAFRPEMESLIAMARRVKSQACSNDSMESLLWLLESEFSFLPNAPRLSDVSVIAMKIVFYEAEERLDYSKVFKSWIQKAENRLKLLADSKQALEDLAKDSRNEVYYFEKIARMYISSISEKEKEGVYRLVCGKYLRYYSEKHRGIDFSYVSQNKSRTSFHGRQVKKSFQIGPFLPPAMLDYLIKQKGAQKKVVNLDDHRKTA